MNLPHKKETYKVFHRIRWARVFSETLGDNAEDGLAFLKVLVPPVKTIPGILYGHTAAHRLEKMLRESITITSIPVSKTVSEQVIRFISLLVEKNHFRDIDTILQKTEELIDRRNGILTVTAETAAPMDRTSEEELKQKIARTLGMAKIKMNILVIPGLMGGYRLRFGGFYVDASLKGQMEKMKAVLEEAALFDYSAYPDEGITNG